MSSRRKVDTSDLYALREKLIRLYEIHGDSKAVAAEMNISQPRLSEITNLCGLKIEKRLVPKWGNKSSQGAGVSNG